MIATIEWLANNWQELIYALGLICTGISIVVRITPTLKDDSIWLPVVKFLSKYIAINDNRDHDELRKKE